jgi:hypothetical protein
MDCPRCKAAFKAMLYRSIWVEDPENMELVMTDRINVVHCPACGLYERQPFPFLATNMGKKVAIWYEPIPDRNIDADIALNRMHFGDDYFLAKAPRIKDWTEFKTRLIELNQRPEVLSTVEDLARLKLGMRSAYAKTTKSRWNYTTFLSQMASFSKRRFPIGFFRRNKPKADGRGCSTPVNPFAKLEGAISTWDREQARIALAIFASTIIKDRAPLETLFGRGAKVETAVVRLTVGQLKVLHSIMTEIVPDDGDDTRAG